MKTKSTNRVVSLLLALFMLLTCVPLTFMATNTAARAEGTTYVLESKDLTAFAAGAKTDGEAEKAGTDNYFTIFYSAKTKIDSSSKTFDDGYESGQRINSSAKASVGQDSVGFTTGGAATVKVWWVSNSDDASRQMVILNSAGDQVDITNNPVAKNGTAIDTLKVSDAGTYYLGSTNGGNYIFKVEVTESGAAEYVFESKDLTAFAAGEKADGDTQKVGTDGFFTVYYSAKTKVDSSNKTFDDGYESGQRLNSSAAASVGKDSVGFTVPGEATVKVWWVSNSDDASRQMVILDGSGNQVDITNNPVAKNGTAIDTLKVSAAGTYYLGSTNGGNYIFKVQVTTGGGEVVRADWADVAAPVITNAVDDGKGNINVTVSAVVGAAGGDGVSVIMYDSTGKQIGDPKNSLGEKAEHTIAFAPTASGTYTFKATLSRDGETDKTSKSVNAGFTLVLQPPVIASATSKGSGTVELVWNSSKEATGYNIYRDGAKVGSTTTDLTFMDKGLTVGKEYKYTVTAVRGSEESAQSEAKTVEATQDAKQTWGFMYYGTSTTAANNYYEGDLNADGKVKVVSNGGKGKFQESSDDGVAFYYTAIPTNQNFTIRAKVHVDTWTYSNGQEGTAIMAIDSLPANPFTDTKHWSNNYKVGAMSTFYRVDPIEGVISDDPLANKISMKVGIGVQTKLGITPQNLDTIVNVGSSGVVHFDQLPLETIAYEKGYYDVGNYAAIGNLSNPGTVTSVDNITDFILELQRNNTGYFLSYYTADGKLVNTQKFYDPKALDVMDKDYVYVGFVSARNFEATYSDVKLTLTDPKTDAPAEERPITYIEPRLSFNNGSNANSSTFKILTKGNVKGTVDVKVGGSTVKSGVAINGGSDYVTIPVSVSSGSNKVEVIFKPDANQQLAEYTRLTSADPITYTINVEYNTDFVDLAEIYVAPNGTKSGKGTKDSPIDIYTAVKVAGPGQTIILMEGTYKLSEDLTIERGIDGASGKLINMFADPEAKTRPVLDFQAKAGMTIIGNYWHLKGFDITNSAEGVSGLVVNGSYNTIERVDAYSNRYTGIYLKSTANSDPKSIWPKYNLILNCTAYDNADAAGEDADGFGAKFAVGVGNVFDGCVAHHNADDGWDFYARGMSIEPVLIRNSVAYENGHNLAGTIKGNGNGFKLGGENMSAGHTIVNSVAFNNDKNGITCNSCPDIKVVNCTTYNNGEYNFTVYSGAANTDFEATGVVSFKDSKSKSQTADSLSPQGTQKESKIKKATDYYWNGSKSVNTAGEEITADMFVSLEFKGVNRKADGSVDLQGFLELNDKAPKNTGAREGGDAGFDNPVTGVDFGFVIAIIALAGAAALVLFIKRRRA